MWRWPGYEEAGDVHDVGLVAGPKGVKKFRSEAASTDYTYKRKLKVPGTYKLNCSLHDEMHMTIKVRECPKQAEPGDSTGDGGAPATAES